MSARESAERFDRDLFEERAFAQRFLMSIKRNPAPPQPKISGALDFVSVDCPTKSDFTKRDEAGNYIDRTLDAMWWAWQESRISLVPADDELPITLDELEKALADSDAYAATRDGKLWCVIDTAVEVKTRGQLRRLCKELGINQRPEG